MAEQRFFDCLSPVRAGEGYQQLYSGRRSVQTCRDLFIYVDESKQLLGGRIMLDLQGVLEYENAERGDIVSDLYGQGAVFFSHGAHENCPEAPVIMQDRIKCLSVVRPVVMYLLQLRGSLQKKRSFELPRSFGDLCSLGVGLMSLLHFPSIPSHTR